MLSDLEKQTWVLTDISIERHVNVGDTSLPGDTLKEVQIISLEKTDLYLTS